MKKSIYLCLFLLFGCYSNQETNTIILGKCNKKEACLYSQLISDDYSFTKNVEINQDKSFRHYSIKVNATKYGENKVREHTLKFSSGSNASCNFFQNAKVPLAGFSERGNPVVFSQQGKYEIFFNSKTTIGCEDCISQINQQGEELNNFFSPVQDFYGYNYKLSNFSIHDDYDGILYKNLAKCILINSNSLFKEVDKYSCEVYVNVGNRDKNFNDLSLKTGDFIYQNKHNKNKLLYIKDNPCE